MILDKITGLNNNIAIVGDSWAFGEWYPIEGHSGSYIDTVPVVSHPSPQQYLHEHFKNLKIYHMAQVGGENNSIARDLKKYKQHFDFGIVYWTCPSRALLNKWERTEKDLSNLTLEEYKHKVEEYSKSALEEFNDCGMPLLFVGGQVSLPDLSDYDNCHAVVDRMTNLIEEPFWSHSENKAKPGKQHNKVDWHSITRFKELGHHIKFSEDFNKEIEEIIFTEYIDIKNKYGFNPYYFPDQGHGGRFLHKPTSAKLIEYIETNNMINTIVN